MAKDFKGKEDADLFKKINNDDYMYSAIIECYQTLRKILLDLMDDECDKMLVLYLCQSYLFVYFYSPSIIKLVIDNLFSFF